MPVIEEIPAGHFSGQRATTHSPGGEDTRSLEQLIQELQQAVNAGGPAVNSAQAVAATASEAAFIASGDGEITSVKAFAGTAAAAAESMSIDVKINGVSCLTAPLVLDDTSGTDVQDGVLDDSAVQLAAGDKVTIERTYVAGGAPTPMADTLISVAATISQ